MPRALSSHPDAVRSRQRRARNRAFAPPSTATRSLEPHPRRARSPTVNTRPFSSVDPDAVRSRRRRPQNRAFPPPSTATQPLLPQPRRADPPTVNTHPFSSLAAARPRALSTPWSPAPCPHCGARLLSSESSKWCCKLGTKLLPPLPPLPPHLQHLCTNQPTVLNNISRRLNYLFCLSAIGASGQFTEYHGQSFFSASRDLDMFDEDIYRRQWSVALSGHTYHRVFPTLRPNHPGPTFLLNAWILSTFQPFPLSL